MLSVFLFLSLSLSFARSLAGSSVANKVNFEIPKAAVKKKSKPSSDTGGFLREKYVILEKNSFKMRLSALKSDESQFFASRYEDEGMRGS